MLGHNYFEFVQRSMGMHLAPNFSCVTMRKKQLNICLALAVTALGTYRGLDKPVSHFTDGIDYY